MLDNLMYHGDIPCGTGVCVDQGSRVGAEPPNNRDVEYTASDDRDGPRVG